MYAYININLRPCGGSPEGGEANLGKEANPTERSEWRGFAYLDYTSSEGEVLVADRLFCTLTKKPDGYQKLDGDSGEHHERGSS